MQTLGSVVRAYMTQQNWEVQKRPNGLHAVIRGHNGAWAANVAWNEDDRWLVLTAIPAFEVPEPLRRRVAEFITRINYGLILGNFQLDFSDGEVSFKSSLRLPETELTDDLLDPLFGTAFSTLDRFIPGLAAIIHGKRSVRWALRACGCPDPTPPAAEPDAGENGHPSAGHAGESAE